MRDRIPEAVHDILFTRIARRRHESHGLQIGAMEDIIVI